MIICGQKFTEDLIVRIQTVVKTQKKMTRSALSRIVCEWLDWRGHNGKLKEMSCRVALGRLAEKGLITLPEVRHRGIPKAARNTDIHIEIPEIECTLKELGVIKIEAVTSRQRDESQIWRTMMDTYHYLGSGPLCGAQQRYLIKSSRYGYLGGLSFSSAAWRLRARDEWIGWHNSAREENLHLVATNSRFLIAPGVRVKNLASHVLSQCAKRLGTDWNKRYGYEPVLLETFVEQGRFAGTSYRAANWVKVGETSGRGRQDRSHRRSVPVKDIYVYPLRKDARKRLCLAAQTNSEESAKIEVKYADWAEEEFMRAELGDTRLLDRLLTIGRDLYARPQANIPQACGTRAKTKAAYRFFQNENVQMDAILKSHYEATTGRMQKEKIALAVQDTTSLNYSAHPMTKNIGLIGSSENGPLGLLVHDTMVFNGEGTPIGLIDVQCWARDRNEYGKKHRRHTLPIEEKESNKWLISYRKASDAQKKCPHTTVVSIGDREADIYELFLEADSDKNNARLLVRAREDRKLIDERRLWEKIKDEPVRGIQEIQLPRGKNRDGRTARLEVKYSRVRLKPPGHKSSLPEITVWAIQAREEGGEAVTDPLEWMLLTNIPVSSFEDAVEKLRWYTLRWGIEVYHRTLKSGCKIEERQLGSADSIKTCFAIDLVVAWRIYHLAKLGRETPNVPCTVYFLEEEWKALLAFVTKNPVPPEKPPSLRTATRMVASLGGFLGRKNDGEPGTKTLWLGLQRLDDITQMWKVMVDILRGSTVSSATDYG